LVLDPIEAGFQERMYGTEIATGPEGDAVRLVVEKEHKA
jgi:hypothetical protein